MMMRLFFCCFVFFFLSPHQANANSFQKLQACILVKILFLAGCTITWTNVYTPRAGRWMCFSHGVASRRSGYIESFLARGSVLKFSDELASDQKTERVTLTV